MVYFLLTEHGHEGEIYKEDERVEAESAFKNVIISHIDEYDTQNVHELSREYLDDILNDYGIALYQIAQSDGELRRVKFFVLENTESYFDHETDEWQIDATWHDYYGHGGLIDRRADN